jgi:hypothetical protein
MLGNVERQKIGKDVITGPNLLKDIPYNTFTQMEYSIYPLHESPPLLEPKPSPAGSSSRNP